MARRNLNACKDRATELGIPDMFSVIVWKEYALKRTREVVEYYHEHNGYPTKQTRLGLWLAGMRQARAGRGKLIWYPECEELAIELGCPDMFELRTEMRGRQVLDNVREIAAFYHEYGRYPPGTAKGGYIGKWLAGMRQARQGKGKFAWHPECEALAIELGCPDMFKAYDYKELALQRTRECAEYYHEHGKYPSAYGENPLGKFLSRMRAAKIGKGRYAWYPECEELAIELGCPDMFVIQRKSKTFKYPS